MKRVVVLSCFTGNGILLLILLFFGIAAVPMPSSKPTQIIPDAFTGTSSQTAADDSTTVTSLTVTTTQSQNSSLVAENLPEDKDPPAIVNNENVTETEIVITEARHGKSLFENHQPHQQDLIAKNESTTTASSSDPNTTLSDFTVKIATDSDPTSQRITEGDAPPKMESENVPKGKPQEFDTPRLVLVPSKAPVQTERDKMIQRIFGGECNFTHWNRCSRIESWGGDYLIPDKNDPTKFIVRHHKIRCNEGPKSTMCLKNGWTVARCHMLCMSQCNVEYRMNYEKLVLHEGDCRLPLLLK